jgi:D-arabinose 1-dehydrogenase-like Zn-dependent alcohol dehydrogenase
MLVASGVRVAVLDLDQPRQDAAREFGAETAFHPTEVLTKLHEWPCADGVQCVYDCVGSRSSFEVASTMVMNGGRMIIVGEQGEHLSVTSTVIAQRELEIVGSRNGTRQDLVEAVRLVADGKIVPLIAARYPLEQVNKAIERVRAGVVGRVVVDVNNNSRQLTP